MKKIIITVIFVFLFVPFGKVSACNVGAFNYGDPSNLPINNRDDCPTIKINDPSADVIRVWGREDEFGVNEKMTDIPDGKIIMPQNEPNLESGDTPTEVAENIKLWVDEALAQGKTGITIMIPPYAHNQGSLNNDILSQQEQVISLLSSSGYLNKGINFTMGVNAYGNYDQVTQMLTAQRNIARSYGISNLVVSEIAIATHQDVVDGKISVADWMHQTAELVYRLQNDPNSQYQGTMMFTSLLIGAQVPLFIDPVTGDYTFGCDDNLYTGNVNTGATSYSGNIEDLGCGAPIGIWGPLDTTFLDDIGECRAPEDYSAALNCLDCTVHEEMDDNRGVVRRLIDNVISFFTQKGFDFDMALKGFENPVPKVGEDTQDLFDEDETPLAYFYGGSGDNCDFQSLDYKYDDPSLEGFVPANIPAINRLLNEELVEMYNLDDPALCREQQERTTVARFLPDHAVSDPKTYEVNVLTEEELEYLGIGLRPPEGTDCSGGCYKPIDIQANFTTDTANINSFLGPIPEDVGTDENRFGAVGWATGASDRVGWGNMTAEYSPSEPNARGSYYVHAGTPANSWIVDGLGNIPADEKLNNTKSDGSLFTGSNHMEFNIGWEQCFGSDCFNSDLAFTSKPYTRGRSGEITAQLQQIPFGAELAGYLIDNLFSTPEKQINGGTVLDIPANELYSQKTLKDRELAFEKAKQEYLVNNYSYQDEVALRKAERGVKTQNVDTEAMLALNTQVETLESATNENFIEKIAQFDPGHCDGPKDGPTEDGCSPDSYPQRTVRVRDLDDVRCSEREDGSVDCGDPTDEVFFGADVIIGCLNGRDCADPRGFTQHAAGVYKNIVESPPLGIASLMANFGALSLLWLPPEEVTANDLALNDNPSTMDVDMGFDDENAPDTLGYSNRPGDSTVIGNIAYPGGAQGKCGARMLYMLSGNPEEPYVDDPSEIPMGEFTRNTKRFLDSYDCFPQEFDEQYKLL